ncbi:hypothetical protein GCM10023205_69920 [Yinghuangia aomiensis]|uniref:Crotonobetainyl-CoA:carnitine CoA-transferase CaiB n=1 Tax=Yinghuangia aomiensis TaxID=676205 RepID=A0ABP9I5F1_9ACTN
MADLGAEVIKIEDPAAGGDVGRYVPPYAEGEDSLFFEVFNRNKRSLSLDLSTAAGRAVFDELVCVSDVVYSNLRGDVPAKIGITYDDLKHLNPRIVCCSLSGFGMTGPRIAEPGYDYVLQGLLGWMDATGEPDGPPTKSGLSLVDYSAGFVAAIAVLAGVHAARRDGVGMDCDVSLFDTALALLNYPAAWHLNAGYTPHRTRRSSHPSLVAAAVLAARDIAGAPRVRRLQVGEADLCAELGVEPGTDERELLGVRSQIVPTSAAAGIEPPVAPASTNFTDLAALQASTEALRRLGYRGRACIHPAQLAVVHGVFTPSAEEVARARALLAG